MDNNFKYYRVYDSYEECMRSPTLNIVCQTQDLEEAKKMYEELNADFYTMYLPALTNETKEFCTKSYNEKRSKSEIPFDEIESIYDNSDDYWNHKPQLKTIEIEFFNLIQK